MIDGTGVLVDVRYGTEVGPRWISLKFRGKAGRSGSSTWVEFLGKQERTHLLVLGQTLLGLGELVALRLLGHCVVVVGGHFVGVWRVWRVYRGECSRETVQ